MAARTKSSKRAPADEGGGAGATVLEIARELYGLPRSEFIPERTARVKALRGDDDREAATLVGKLAKPSVVAWAVNAATRVEPKLAGELVEVVAKMQSAGSARETAARHDELVQSLVDAARTALADADEQTSATRMAAVATAIRSASLAGDPAAFLEGRLADEAASSDDTLEAALRAGAIATSRRTRATGADTESGTDENGDDASVAKRSSDGGGGTRSPGRAASKRGGASAKDTDAAADAKAEAEAEALATRRAEERRLKAELADAKAAARATKAAAREAERDLKRAERELAKSRRARDDAADADEHAQRLAGELADELAALD